MKKKAIALVLAMSMSFVMCACGSSETTEQEEPVQEETTADTEETDEGEESTDETEAEASVEEVNEYGFTASQQEALVESVKNSITTDYLEKYNIPASDFNLRPYDVNDLFHYNESGEYTGDDPYESAPIWGTVDRVIFNSGGDFALKISALMEIDEDPEYIADEIKSMLENGSLTFPATLEEAGYELKTEHDTLTNAVYKGIAGYLSSLDTEECAELLAHLCKIKNENTEYVDVPFYEGASQAMGQPTMTVFDKVITENLQF